MKKAKLLLLGLTSLALASCSLFGGKDKGGDDEKAYDYEPANGIVGGTEAEQTAILEALNNRPMSNLNGKTSTEIFPYPDSYMTLKEDEGDGIKLTKSQVIGDLTVKITWSVPEQEYFAGNIKESDAAHDIVEIAYKGYDYGKAHGLGEFNWSIKKMECGGAVADNANIPFKAKVQNEQFMHEDCYIEDLYKFTDQKITVAGHKFDGTFDLVDYEEHEGKEYSPYFKTNNPEATEKQYWYVNVVGKVIYLAPDGDWGLIADGDHVLEIFAGSGTAFTPVNWPNLGLNKYVRVSGNLGQYQGNLQLGFVTKIREAAASELKAEPTGTYHELTAEKLALLESSYIGACQKQAVAIDGVEVVGSLRKVTGTLVAGSIAIKDGEPWPDGKDASQLVKEKRFMFKLQVGAKVISVAYDYHVEFGGTAGVFSKLQTKLAAGGSMTIGGTMRFFGNDSSPFITEGNSGVWSICPFDATQIL